MMALKTSIGKTDDAELLVGHSMPYCSYLSDVQRFCTLSLLGPIGCRRHFTQDILYSDDNLFAILCLKEYYLRDHPIF